MEVLHKMKKKILCAAIGALTLTTLTFGVSAATTHKVAAGDTMWKIAVRYEVGLSEIKDANSHIANPNLIYPGQILNIPTVDATVTNYESEVVRLVNEKRAQNGLGKLMVDWELSRVARYKS